MKNKSLVITIAIVVILVISTLSLWIYYRENEYSNINVKTIDIMDNISVSLNGDIPEMMQLDDEEVIENYSIDITKLEEYIIKIPIINIRANEIAIIKVKNIRDVDYIKNKLEERVKVVQNTFEGYLQDQFELAKNALIISRGKYILLSISDRNDDIENIFKSYFIVSNK